jgi:integrase
LKGRSKPYKVADANGLYLLIKPDGAKYWRPKYRHAGKEKLLALGVYPDVPLADARQAQDDTKALIKKRLDAVNARKQQQQAVELASANTFDAVARDWIDKQKQRWIPTHVEAVLDSFEKNIFPDVGSRPITSITAPELLASLGKVEKRGALDTAQRLLQRCSRVFRYGITPGSCTYDPAGDQRGALAAPKRNNYAALSADELPEFLSKLEAYDGRLETELALRLLLLTMLRSGELRGAQWTEMDVDAAQWQIPAEPREDAHRAPRAALQAGAGGLGGAAHADRDKPLCVSQPGQAGQSDEREHRTKWHAEEEAEYAAKGIKPAEVAEDSRRQRPLRGYRKTPEFRRHTKKNSGVTHSLGQERRG